MISKILFKKIAATMVVAGVAMYMTAAFAAAQSSAAPPAQTASAASRALDFEFFKTRVEPIFLKKRAGHSRCYACHSGNAGPAYLEKLSPGSTFWTEDQSRLNFQHVSLFVVPGNTAASRLLTHPLAPEAGGDFPHPSVHRGGRQFASEDDPDWQIIAEWVRAGKAGAPSAK